jgi:hypothetical protein
MGSRFSDDVVLCLSEKIGDKSLETLMRLGLSDWFPNEFATWERGRKDVIQCFQEARTERRKEMHTVLERNLEDMKNRLREAVTFEVLKVFP